MSHADRFAGKPAHCRGIRRIHFRTNMSACEQVPAANSAQLCKAHCSRKSQFVGNRNLNFKNITMNSFLYNSKCRE